MNLLHPGFITRLLSFVAILAGVNIAPQMGAQANSPSAASGKVPASSARVYFPPNRFSNRAASYYALLWGVDSLSVRAAESGEIIRFTYRVLDASKAKTLNDKQNQAFLNAPDEHVQLVIPTMEKVGQLRQTSTPVAGKSYWMAFSNSGRSVKRGDRVNVVIGQFHVDGLVVE
jgi:hypothetical protein